MDITYYDMVALRMQLSSRMDIDRKRLKRLPLKEEFRRQELIERILMNGRVIKELNKGIKETTGGSKYSQKHFSGFSRN